MSEGQRTNATTTWGEHKTSPQAQSFMQEFMAVNLEELHQFNTQVADVLRSAPGHSPHNKCCSAPRSKIPEELGNRSTPIMTANKLMNYIPGENKKYPLPPCTRKDQQNYLKYYLAYWTEKDRKDKTANNNTAPATTPCSSALSALPPTPESAPALRHANPQPMQPHITAHPIDGHPSAPYAPPNSLTTVNTPPGPSKIPSPHGSPTSSLREEYMVTMPQSEPFDSSRHQKPLVAQNGAQNVRPVSALRDDYIVTIPATDPLVSSRCQKVSPAENPNQHGPPLALMPPTCQQGRLPLPEAEQQLSRAYCPITPSFGQIMLPASASDGGSSARREVPPKPVDITITSPTSRSYTVMSGTPTARGGAPQQDVVLPFSPIINWNDNSSPYSVRGNTDSVIDGDRIEQAGDTIGETNVITTIPPREAACAVDVPQPNHDATVSPTFPQNPACPPSQPHNTQDTSLVQQTPLPNDQPLPLPPSSAYTNQPPTLLFCPACRQPLPPHICSTCLRPKNVKRWETSVQPFHGIHGGSGGGASNTASPLSKPINRRAIHRSGCVCPTCSRYLILCSTCRQPLPNPCPTCKRPFSDADEPCVSRSAKSGSVKSHMSVDTRLSHDWRSNKSRHLRDRIPDLRYQIVERDFDVGSHKSRKCDFAPCRGAASRAEHHKFFFMGNRVVEDPVEVDPMQQNPSKTTSYRLWPRVEYDMLMLESDQIPINTRKAPGWLC